MNWGSVVRNRAGVALAASGLVGLGLAVGMVVTSSLVDGAPPGVATPVEIVVDVPLSQLDGAVEVQLVISSTDRDPLLLNAAGLVTATPCEPGRALASGDVVAGVDGRSVRLLATAVPMWRDLRVGDSGSDVSALQTELRRLGHSATTSGRVDAGTAAAVRSLFGGDAAAGASGVTLARAAMVWSPLPTITPLACDLRLGSAVNPGDRVLTPTPDVARIAVASSASAVPGRERTLTLGSVTVALPAEGAVTDQADVAALTSTPEFAAWLADTSESRQISGQLALDEAITVGSVPPAAVVGVDTPSPCLIDPDGRATAVVIVSSRLGLALVAPAAANATLPQRAVVDPSGSRTCPSS